MPDLDRLLQGFDPAPEPPVTGPEIRRRGERRRRRARALVAGGAALVVVAVAAPLTLVDRGGEGGPPAASAPSTAPEVSPLAADLPAADRLPDDGVVAGRGPWRVVDTDPPALVTCRPDVGPDQLAASERATAQFAAEGTTGDPVDSPVAVVAVTLLEFPDQAAADAAAATVEGWAAECGEAAVSLDARGRFTSIAEVDGDDGRARVQALGVDRDRRQLALVSYSAASDLPVGTLGSETRRVLGLTLGVLRASADPLP